MKKITVFCCIMFSVRVSGMISFPCYANDLDNMSYMQSITEDLVKLQNQNESHIKEINTLKKEVKKLKNEHDIRERYTEEVEKELDNEKNKNRNLLKVLSEKDREIKKLREKIEILNLPTEGVTEVVGNFNNRKEIPENLKQDIIKYISYLQYQSVAKIQELNAMVEYLSEENAGLKEQISDMTTLDRSISRIEEGLPLSDEIKDAFIDQNSSNMILKDLDSEINCKQENDDWGQFLRKDSMTDGGDFLQLKGGSFLINGRLADNTFFLFHKGDYIRFGFEHWRKGLVEFKLTDDIYGEFSLSKSDFLSRQQLCDWLPGRLFRISSQKEGKDDSVIITKDFVYKGESESSAPNGMGVMLKNTGEVLTGKFENGEFIR
jgi:hypothetical protein